jgi:hypothetical protein
MNMLLYYSKANGNVERIFWVEDMFAEIIASNYLAATHDYLIAPSVPVPADVFTHYLLHVDLVTKAITQMPMPPNHVPIPPPKPAGG